MASAGTCTVAKSTKENMAQHNSFGLPTQNALRLARRKMGLEVHKFWYATGPSFPKPYCDYRICTDRCRLFWNVTISWIDHWYDICDICIFVSNHEVGAVSLSKIHRLGTRELSQYVPKGPRKEHSAPAIPWLSAAAPRCFEQFWSSASWKTTKTSSESGVCDVNLIQPTELFVNDPSTCIFTRNLWSCIWRNLRLEIAQKSLERVPLSYAFQNKKHRTAMDCLTPQLCFRLSAVLCEDEHFRTTYLLWRKFYIYMNVYYTARRVQRAEHVLEKSFTPETFYTKTFLYRKHSTTATLEKTLLH